MPEATGQTETLDENGAPAGKRGVYIKTYGCQMNVYDSRRMAEVLRPHGFAPVESPEEADLVILNTCHIREKAAEKVYSEVGRLRGLKEQKARAGRPQYLAVAGCVAQAEGAEMLRRAPAVDLVLGPQTYHRLPAMIEEADAQHAAGRPVRVLDTDFPAEDKFDFLPEEFAEQGPTAFVTVQEGCDKFCSFCVVPYTRGAEASRPVAAVEQEVRRLVDNGVREVTLLGQNVNAYHGETETGATVSLAGLIRHIAAIEGLDRIRYTTSHPLDMREDLIAAHGEVPELMPYLHLPVQSGSDRVLAAMNRRHSAEDYLAIIERVRAARPDIALSGDFIVGFPGETEADFDATMALVRAAEYAHAYSFKYSPRPGTPASEKDAHVAEEVKAERLDRLQRLLNDQQQRFNAASIGRRDRVLLERRGRGPGQLVGRNPYMQAVHIDFAELEPSETAALLDAEDAPAYNAAMGRMIEVDIVQAGPNSLKGRPTGREHARSAA